MINGVWRMATSFFFCLTAVLDHLLPQYSLFLVYLSCFIKYFTSQHLVLDCLLVLICMIYDI